MASSSNRNLGAGIMHTWCLALLLLASLSAAQAQNGAYGEAEASGSYGYGAPDTNAPTQDVAWADQLQYGMRGLLADDLLVQPTASAVPDPDNMPSDHDKSSESDIVPKPLPSTKSWDSATAQHWDDWFAEHFGSAIPISTADGGAYGHSTSVGSYGYGPSEGPYGTVGAYFDHKSNKAYIPAVVQDDLQQPIQEQGPGAIPDAVSTSNSRSSDTAVNIAQIQPGQKPAIGGISRGRGTAIRQSRSPMKSPGQQQPEAAKSLRFDMAGTPIGPVSPSGQVPRRALKGFSRKLRLITF